MNPVIKGGNTAGMLRIALKTGEGLYALSDLVMAHSGGLAFSNRQDGGLLSKLARKFASGHFQYQEISAVSDDQWLMLAPSLTGAITSIDLHSPVGILADEQSFIAATSTTIIGRKIKTVDNIGSEEIETIHFSGNGTIFLNSCGAVEAIVLLPEQEIFVATAHLIAWEENIAYQKTPNGMTKMTGPGRIWLQTRTLHSMVQVRNTLLSGKK